MSFDLFIDDKLTITFPNGWELSFSFWTVGLVALAVATLVAAILIRVVVRGINRRDDRHLAKTPNDHP